MSIEEFERYRSKLFGIAYRMLGTVAEAEDAVQDTYIRWHQTHQQTDVETPEAYLVTITTRLCIDTLKSARVRRENYIGPWLPEPLMSDASTNPEAQQEQAESLSFAFMLLLEQLNPMERAVYILREAFDFKHQEIAKILDHTVANSRQLYRRARLRLEEPVQKFAARDLDQEPLFTRFIGVAAGNNLELLVDHLADDISVYTDGGGKVRAALRVLEGKARVIEFIRRVLPQQDPQSEIEFCWANGQPALRQILHGVTTGLISVDFIDGKAQQLFVVRNPDKLVNAARMFNVL